MLTVGISSNIDKIGDLGKTQLEGMIKNLYREKSIQEALGRGVRAIIRFRSTTEVARTYFGE